MKRTILLFAGCTALLAGCAAEPRDGAQRAAAEDTYIPTGSNIPRRNVDRAGGVKSVGKEELESLGTLGGAAVGMPRN